MHSQNGIVHLKALMGRYELPPPGSRNGRCYAAASNFRCACGAAVRPSQLQPLDMSVDDVGPSRRDPLRASSRFWTANLLISESGTSTRPFPSPLCHLTSPDWTVRGPHRGVAPLSLTRLPKPSSTGAARFTLPLLLATPRRVHPVLAISPATPLRDGFRTAFPAGHFLPVSASRQEEPASQNIPWLHRRRRNTLANHVGGDHSPYRNGARGGAAGSITLDPSNLIL